jgi:POTRA domain-containing FtsQ-type protein
MPERSLNRRLRRPRSKPARSPRNRRRPNRVQIAGRVILSMLAVQALWSAFHSPHLRVRRVEVVGAGRLGAARAAQLADVPLGSNIFRVNLYRARVAVERDPLVESASVTRALPDAVRICVRERHPLFTVTYADQCFEADSAGVLFRRVPRPTPQLRVLALRNVGPIRLGQRLPPSIMNPALACLRLTARDRMLLSEIGVDGPHELWLNMTVPSRPSVAPTAGGAGRTMRIRLGRPEDLSLKLEDARRILAGRPQVLEDARYLDVSCAGRPVYMAQTPSGPTSPAAEGAAGVAAPAVPVTH